MGVEEEVTQTFAEDEAEHVKAAKVKQAQMDMEAKLFKHMAEYLKHIQDLIIQPSHEFTHLWKTTMRVLGLLTPPGPHPEIEHEDIQSAIEEHSVENAMKNIDLSEIQKALERDTDKLADEFGVSSSIVMFL